VLSISVITVTRNSVATVEETIRSIERQRYPNKEHIIIDGASTDGTLAVIERHRANIAALVSERDSGMYDAMNKGLALATGDVVGFLNGDDVYTDDSVLEQVATTMARPGVDACYADLVYVDKNNPAKVVRFWKSRPYQDGLFARGWMPAHPTFFVRREFYQRFGGFDPAYLRQADFELAMRFFLKGRLRAEYIPQVLVRMRSGGASSGLKHVWYGNLESYRACRAHGLDVTPFFIARKILSRIPQFFRRTRLA
jgi:glycosyltransferase involved in cell wall biosynthesis